MLPISITGQGFDVTDALSDYIHTKLSRLDKHVERITQVHVVLTVENLTQIVKANVSLPGDTLHAHTEDRDMYAAIDKLVDELDRQAIKYKEKRTTNKHKSNGAWPEEPTGD